MQYARLRSIDHSIKAGGVALNLTEASHVFICDVSQYPPVHVQLADLVPCSLGGTSVESILALKLSVLTEFYPARCGVSG